MQPPITIYNLLATLEAHQQVAVTLLKTALDCYNSMEGQGLFTGVHRYNVLAQRAALASVQAQDLHGFWACLLRKMQWELPPKRMDVVVMQAIAAQDGGKVLRALATETVSLVTLARILHDADKGARRKDLTAPDDELPNDSLEGL